MSADGGVLAFGTDEQHPYAAGGFQILHAACLPAAGAPAPAPGRDAVGTRTDRATGPSTDPAPGRSINTVALAACLDGDGLSLLLAFLSAGPGRPGEGGPAVLDLDEFVDVVRRLHVPYYEPARVRFDDPPVRAALRRADRVGPYQSTELRRLAPDRSGSAAPP